MKPRLPHRLIQVLLTTSAAALSSTPSFADVPEGYKEVYVTNVAQLADYTQSDYKAFIIGTDITDSTYKMTGAHQYWTDYAPETHNLTFARLEKNEGGGALYITSELIVEKLNGLDFLENSVMKGSSPQARGGAICCRDASACFSEIKEVTFSNNSAAGTISEGGGMYSYSGFVSFSENGSVIFSNNSASSGGGYASVTSDTLKMTGNGVVSFGGNTADIGGALFASYSTVSFSENEEVSFSNNSATEPFTRAGAIYSSGSDIDLTGNRVVSFNNNTAIASTPSISTYSAWGGAIYAVGSGATTSLTGNGEVTFNNNSVSAPNTYGGAISIYCGHLFNIMNNDTVIFNNNSVTGTKSDGGAIDCTWDSSLCIEGNGAVTFRGNFVKTGSDEEMTCRLRGVSITDSSMKLAAGEKQSITFYDTLYVDADSTLSLNAAYQDKNGETQDATGDIIFSGMFVKEDLKKLKDNATQQELAASHTTEVYTTTNLYGGRLRIEDGAIYKGNGVNVATDSAATLRLDNGTLNQTGYNVEMHAGTTLDLEGENSITASTLKMMDGSTLSFNLGSQEGALLSLNGILNTGKITIALSGDMQNAHELINLADVSQYDTTMWSEQRIAVSGTNFKHLVWNNGTLSYAGIIESHIDLDNDKEIADFDGGDIVDIEGNGHKLTVKHPVDLVRLAMKDGVVRLEGEDNNVVRITLTEDGTLQLAAGAGLNVGNIVSMVANGSADLEIAGDIEISDIKAYGRPGNKGTLSYVNMTTAGDYTIENMTITGSVIDVGEGTTLYLVNVDIKSDTHITDDPARVFAQSAHVELNGTNTWVDQEITAAQDTLLYMCGDTQRSITLAVGSEIVELTSSMFDSVTLTGTDLWLDMTGIAEATYGKDYFTLDFQDLAREMAKAQVDVENLHVYATLDGEKYLEAYSTANGGLTTTLYFQVPEPTTGTLSLLALAALAARRKKK